MLVEGFIQRQKLLRWKWLLIYMRNVFGGVFGMEIIDEVIIEGHNAMPEKAQEIIAAGMKEVKAAAQRLIELTLKV